MAGVKSNINEIQTKLKNLLIKIEQPKEVLSQIGEILLNNTRDRLEQGVDIYGSPFKPLAALTIQTKKRNKDKILIESGDLFRELSYQLVNGGESLEFGSDRKYAALQQFGGVITPKKKKVLKFKGKFRKRVEIPARPFIGITPKDRQQISATLIALLDKSMD